MKIKLIEFNKNYYKPSRSHYNDAGADIYAISDYSLGIGETKCIPLGFGIEVPDGYTACIFPRSSLASKGLFPQLSPIDSGYRGEIHCILTNTSDKVYQISAGDRIGQLVVFPIVICDFTTKFTDERMQGAFGSTGK